jgi:hypothetical protein
MRYCFVLVLATWVVAPVRADVYKCVDADGKLSFTDRPCPKGAQSETLEVSAPQDAGAPTAVVPPACIELAQPVWRLQTMEAGGRLSAPQRTELNGARNRLEQECRLRLASSSLAFRCQERQADVTAATSRAADPAHADELAIAEADYKRQCDDGAINADIRLHLRPGASAR